MNSIIDRTRFIARKIASIELWAAGLAVGASIISARYLAVALIVLITFWLVRWLATGKLSVRTPADWGTVLLMLMVPVTLLATAIPETTRPQVARLVTGVGLYYAAVNWATTRRRLRWLGYGMMAAGLCLALIAPMMVTWNISKFSALLAPVYSRFTVLVQDTVHPNVMAGVLVILLPIPMAWLLFGWKEMRWSMRALALISLGGMGLVLGLSLSRGAWMGLGAVLIMFTLLRWKRGWVLVLLGGAAGMGAAYWVGIPQVLDALLLNSSLSGLDGRLEIWSRGLKMIQDFPITGIGTGTFGPVADVLYPLYLAEPGSVPHAHNLFLQIAVDLGIPGLVFWLAILMTNLALAWKLFRAGQVGGDKLAALLGAGLLCSQTALVVHGLTDAVTWGMVRTAPFVWLTWGITAACWNVTKGNGVQQDSQHLRDGVELSNKD
jgi:putative inorganic carbon (hco3(-)) transporter